MCIHIYIYIKIKGFEDTISQRLQVIKVRRVNRDHRSRYRITETRVWWVVEVHDALDMGRNGNGRAIMRGLGRDREPRLHIAGATVVSWATRAEIARCCTFDLSRPVAPIFIVLLS